MQEAIINCIRPCSGNEQKGKFKVETIGRMFNRLYILGRCLDHYPL